MKAFVQLVCISVFTLLPWQSSYGFELNSKTQVEFADKAQGQKALGRVDEFVKRLSDFDRAARMQTDQKVAQGPYLEFVQSQVLDWTEQDKTLMTTHLMAVKKVLGQYAIELPAQVLLVKTSGMEEGNAAYTRENVIVFNPRFLNMPEKMLRTIVFHEFFHVISRANPELKQKLYQIIGFKKAEELAFPKSLAARKLTNPDAPVNDHYLTLNHQDKAWDIVPILYGVEGGYDVKKGGPFFQYMQFKLLAVNVVADKPLEPVMVAGEPLLFNPSEVKDYFNKIGGNTNYIIHPEEVMADNFSYLMTGKTGLPNPEILEKIKQVLPKAK